MTWNTAFAQNQRQVNYRSPVRQYVLIKQGDREFHVEKELSTRDPKLMRKALRRLDENIDRAIALFPEPQQRVIEVVPFYLMYGEASSIGGRKSGLAYFQRDVAKHRDWVDAKWGSNIVVYSAKNYVDVTDFWAIKAVVHELAHAYQLEQWIEKQPEILAAYRNAMDKGLYQGVRDDKGKTLAKAYAATNQLEYFAELTCMHYVGCNYFPNDRRRLKQYDVKGHSMIQSIWDPARSPKSDKPVRRLWIDVTGNHRTIGRLTESNTELVRLEKDDGNVVDVPIDQLSGIDRNYIDRQRSAGE